MGAGNSTAALAHEVAARQSARSLAISRLRWNRRVAYQVTSDVTVGGTPQLLATQTSPEAAGVAGNLAATSSRGERSRRGRGAFCDLVLEIRGHQFCLCSRHCERSPGFNATSGWRPVKLHLLEGAGSRSVGTDFKITQFSSHFPDLTKGPSSTVSRQIR